MTDQPHGKKRVLLICQASLERVATLTRLLNEVKLLESMEGVELHVAWLLSSSYRRDPARRRWVERIRRDWHFHNLVVYGLPPSGIDALDRFASAGFRLLVLAAYVISRRIEIVHVHSFCGVQGGLLRLGRFLGVRCVLDMQGAHPEELAYRGERPSTVRRVDARECRILQTCDSVFCVSRNMVDHLVRKHGLLANNFHVLPCCVPRATVRVDPERRRQVRQILGLEDKFVLVYSGGTASYQCVSEMCALFADIARQSEKAAWLILSWGSFDLFRRHLAERGVDLRQCLFKRLEQDQVHDYLMAGDAGLLLRENHLLNRVSSPTKFAEYLAAGLPVITTPYVGDISGAVVREGVGTVVELPPATDVDALAAFLTKVQHERARFARQCLAYAGRAWAWEGHKAEFREAIGVGDGHNLRRAGP